MIGDAVVLDLDRGGVDYGYTAEDFDEAGQSVEPGDIVLIYSGYKDADLSTRMRQTFLTAEAAQWLVDRGVTAVGVEPCSPDPLYAGMYEYGWLEKDTPNPRRGRRTGRCSRTTSTSSKASRTSIASPVAGFTSRRCRRSFQA